MKERIHKFSRWLEANEQSCGFITSISNVFYFTGFYHDPHERLQGVFVFPNDEPILVCPNMEVSQARQSGWDHAIVSYDDTDDPWKMMKDELSRRNIKVESIAIEASHLSYERSQQLQQLYPGVTFTQAEEKLNELRMLKDENEIKVLKEAAKLADYGVEVGIEAISLGKTEIEIIATIEYELKKKGIQKMSFDTIVLSGDKTAAPHGKPSLNEVKDGDFVLFDLGVVLDGYCSDITRTIVFGKADENKKEIYNTVLAAQKAAVAACKPAVPIGTIDQTARDIISNAGYGDYFIHRIGHGLGIDVHEYPSMTATNESILEKGMTFTIEPGIYVPHVGGVRIEDDLLITENGVESLTSYPKELIELK